MGNVWEIGIIVFESPFLRCFDAKLKHLQVPVMPESFLFPVVVFNHSSVEDQRGNECSVPKNSLP